MVLEDDRSFNDYVLLNRFFDKRHDHNDMDNDIILECQMACSKLSKKKIKIHSVSNYDSQYLYILLDHLSEQNIELIEDMIMIDDRYFYSIEENKYGIRVNNINEEAAFELAELTDIFYPQKNYQKTLVRVN